jgi:mono/diheme cytochrome c family protein
MRTEPSTLAALALVVFGAATAAHAETASGPVIAQGQQLYLDKGCADCHGSTGQGSGRAGSRLAPDPIALVPFTEQLRRPRNTMPSYSEAVLSNEEVRAIHAYLGSLPKAEAAGSAAAPTTRSDRPGSSSLGRKLYMRTGCYQCHGVQGQGAGFYGPQIAPNPISLDLFARQLRLPRGKMPIYTPIVLSDQDLRDIYAYMRSIPRAKSVAEIPLLNR